MRITYRFSLLSLSAVRYCTTASLTPPPELEGFSLFLSQSLHTYHAGKELLTPRLAASVSNGSDERRTSIPEPVEDLDQRPYMADLCQLDSLPYHNTETIIRMTYTRLSMHLSRTTAIIIT